MQVQPVQALAGVRGQWRGAVRLLHPAISAFGGLEDGRRVSLVVPIPAQWP